MLGFTFKISLSGNILTVYYLLLFMNATLELLRFWKQDVDKVTDNLNFAVMHIHI